MSDGRPPSSSFTVPVPRYPSKAPTWARAAMPIVARTAATLRRRLPSTVSVDDLQGAGLLAVVELRQRHPTLPSDELARLARDRVRGAMLDELRRSDPLSRAARKRARDLESAEGTFSARTGGKASDGELATMLGVSARTVGVAQELRARTVSSAAKDGDSVDEVPGTSTPSPEEATHQRQRLDRFSKAVTSLKTRPRSVVSLYYSQERTLREIGEQLGVTEARVSQILSTAVDKLRVACASVPPPPV